MHTKEGVILKEHQAREYIFETKVKKIIGGSGYVSIKDDKVLGRSGEHDVNACGVLNIPTAFVLPVRMIGQYKFYAKNKVELSHIRDFTGIMKDISESNFAKIDGNKNTPNRYTDVGCYFSATGFTRPAQEYAWAHNIFLVSFERNNVVLPVLAQIQDFVSGLSETVITNITKSELLAGYKIFCKNYGEVKLPQGAIGIVNGSYPVVLTGAEGWVGELVKISKSGIATASKINRYVNQFESNFEITLENNSIVEFCVPNVIMEKLMAREDNPTLGECVFKLDIPFVKKQQKGIISIDIIVDGFAKEEYSYQQLTLI
ncbi:MAG: hypothetical protein ACI4DS_05920 [Eubacterium sp.]